MILMGIRSWIRAIGRHRALAAGILLATVALGLLMIPGAPLTFTATARVAIPDEAPVLSSAVLERAIRSDLASEFAHSTPEELASSMSRLRSASRVTREKGAAVVTCGSWRPSLAVSMANALARALEATSPRTGRETTALERRLPETAEETPLRLARTRLAELERARAAAPIEMADLTARLDGLTGRIDRGEAGPPKAVDSTESDRLSSELDAARGRLEALRAIYPEDWPPVLRAAADIEEIRARRDRALTRETNAARFAPVREILEEIRTLSAQRERLRSEEGPREARIAGLRAQVEKLSKERPAATEGAPDAGAPPIRSDQPSRVEPAATAVMTGFTLPILVAVGLILAFAAANIAESLATTIRTEHDVRRYVNLPLLGVVPFVDEEDRLLVSGDPRAPLAEPFNTAATLLESRAKEVSAKVFALTSASAGEGKSTAASNLALAIARGGLRVLLIDADLRRGKQYRNFSIANTPGLSTYITGATDSVDAILAGTGVESLKVLPAGPFLDQPLPYLRSERFKAMLEEFRGRFDFILIDLPPVGVASDALVVAPLADGILLVLSAPETRKDEAAEAKRLLRGANATLVGCVLTKATVRSRGYYYYSAAPAAATE